MAGGASAHGPGGGGGSSGSLGDRSWGIGRPVVGGLLVLLSGRRRSAFDHAVLPWDTPAVQDTRP